MSERAITSRGIARGSVQALLGASLVVSLNTGCGDGVGRPIRARDMSVGTGGASDHVTDAQESGGQRSNTGSESASEGGQGLPNGSGGTSFTSSPGGSGGTSALSSPGEFGGTNFTSAPGGSGGTSSGGTGSPSNSGGARSGNFGGMSSGPGGSNGGQSAGPPPPPSSSPTGPSPCSIPQPWPPDQAAAELELLNNINALRQSGAPCPGGPARSASPALVMVDELRCVARSQSFDKFAGRKLATRISDANYAASAFAEVTANSPPVNFDIPTLLWFILNNPSNCTKVFDATFSVVGIGFATDPNQGYWTIDLASP